MKSYYYDQSLLGRAHLNLHYAAPGADRLDLDQRAGVGHDHAAHRIVLIVVIVGQPIVKERIPRLAGEIRRQAVPVQGDGVGAPEAKGRVIGLKPVADDAADTVTMPVHQLRMSVHRQEEAAASAGRIPILPPATLLEMLETEEG